MDDGAGNFTDIHGVNSDTLALSALVSARKGITYGFRYRAKNIYGWSGFSPIAYILAASLPSTPSRPSFVSASDNSI
jgi:hypothetical protein